MSDDKKRPQDDAVEKELEGVPEELLDTGEDEGDAGENGIEEALAALQSHDWPGNVRQLRNIMERTMILTPGDRAARIDIDLLPSEVTKAGEGQGGAPQVAMMGSPLREARENFEREYLRIQIRRFSGNISRTATFIGMERSALHRKLKALGITDKRDDKS